ncbi:L-threonine synthase [Desulfacinum hydrothermale DSM 13146]|uniref:Threonine synthase n=1 Tax=Desulfacinum hydrothermale DSM 13146 TaxID=1121390 RepID=A0A1W1WYJ2_9BACT|nr:threonine synthase [Desulfacinum hydrothermale]SMC16498.1 L-threonine synthase [Desulfacinum hydrothermale DSM 13146]
MKCTDFPESIRPYVVPEVAGRYIYRCLGCQATFGVEELLYTCPQCGSVLMIRDEDWDRLKAIPGPTWRRIFDYRAMVTEPALKGIYRFHELLGSILPLDAVIYLGEGHTPVVQANAKMRDWVGRPFFFKNDGQNPSASFKDRGMASAFSYLNHLIKSQGLTQVLAVCASTGDTSAAAALYASYLVDGVTSAVLLPQGKVTPQQLSQPLGSGARVIEIPGVFDDCMKIVEYLAEHYPVALMNSKNAWRILGQESYSYEIAQAFDYEVADLVVTVPIGNAGNITAVMAGFLKLHDLGIITQLPWILGVQSHHADPVYRYYLEPDPQKREFRPVTVQPSVAQAAMIGNPVSMPRVVQLVEQFRSIAGDQAVQVVQVTEQEIMDAMLRANRNGHIACTQGGECLAGWRRAVADGAIPDGKVGVLDATAHALKFAIFQEKYFEDRFEPEFGVVPKEELRNRPVLVRPPQGVPCPVPGAGMDAESFRAFVTATGDAVASMLGLRK